MSFNGEYISEEELYKELDLMMVNTSDAISYCEHCKVSVDFDKHFLLDGTCISKEMDKLLDGSDE